MTGGATILQFTAHSDSKTESRYFTSQKCQAHSLWDFFFKIIFFPDHGTVKYYMHPLLKELNNNEIQKGCFSSAQ